jgi:hypothetical protein
MPAPTYTAGTLGNVINGVSIAAGKNTAAAVDLSTSIGGSLLCKIQTASSTVTAGTTFSAYRVSGATIAGNTTLAAAATAGATSLSVSSATGIGKITTIALVTASGLVGEIASVTNVSGTTLTVNALINSYSTNDLVFLIEQSPSGGLVVPGTSWAANTEYSTSLYPQPPAVWIIAAKNGDATNSVTVTITLDKTPTIQ